jgi:hypothetical protein
MTPVSFVILSCPGRASAAKDLGVKELLRPAAEAFRASA